MVSESATVAVYAQLCDLCFNLFLSALVEYKSLSGKTLQESIEGEMSGRLEDILVAIGDIIKFCLLRHY